MKISVKKIVLISLLIVVGLPVLFVSLVTGTLAYDGWRMSKGEYPLADSSEARIGRFVLRLDRYAIHPFLAEYKRVLAITDGDGKSWSRDLFTDTGGGGLVTVCETNNGNLRLADRFEINIVRTDGRLWEDHHEAAEIARADFVSEPGHTSQPGCKRMLGRFDRDDARKYGFHAVEGL
jgi:hypothetical protein